MKVKERLKMKGSILKTENTQRTGRYKVDAAYC